MTRNSDDATASPAGDPAGEAEPKGVPSSDRYQTEVAHQDETEQHPGDRPAEPARRPDDRAA